MLRYKRFKWCFLWDVVITVPQSFGLGIEITRDHYGQYVEITHFIQNAFKL